MSFFWRLYTAEFCAAEEGIPSTVLTFEMTRQLYSYNTVKFLYTRLFLLGILEHGVECNTRSLPLDFTALEKKYLPMLHALVSDIEIP